jgi:hypothetical protein
LASLEFIKSAFERHYSAIFSDPGESLECAFVSFLCCRKVWVVQKELKLIILYCRPTTKFLWLGAARFAFSGPLEHRCFHILQHLGAAGHPTVLLCCHCPVSRACHVQGRSGGALSQTASLGDGHSQDDANHRQPPPTTANHRRPPPTTANHRQPPPTTANHRQPPPTTANHRQQPPPTTTANNHRQQPPPKTTANNHRQPLPQKLLEMELVTSYEAAKNEADMGQQDTTYAALRTEEEMDANPSQCSTTEQTEEKEAAENQEGQGKEADAMGDQAENTASKAPSVGKNARATRATTS